MRRGRRCVNTEHTALEKIYPHRAEGGRGLSAASLISLFTSLALIQSDSQAGRDSVSLLNGILTEREIIEPVSFCF